MAEKLRLMDRDFWRNPSIWRVGEGYVPTRSVIESAVAVGGALVGLALVGVQGVEIREPVELIKLVPYMFPVALIRIAMDQIVREAVVMHDYSKEVIKKGEPDLKRTRQLSNYWLDYENLMIEHEVNGDGVRIEKLMAEKRRVEKSLLDFASKVMKRTVGKNKSACKD